MRDGSSNGSSVAVNMQLRASLTGSNARVIWVVWRGRPRSGRVPSRHEHRASETITHAAQRDPKLSLLYFFFPTRCRAVIYGLSGEGEPGQILKRVNSLKQNTKIETQDSFLGIFQKRESDAPEITKTDTGCIDVFQGRGSKCVCMCEGGNGYTTNTWNVMSLQWYLRNCKKAWAENRISNKDINS